MLFIIRRPNLVPARLWPALREPQIEQKGKAIQMMSAVKLKKLNHLICVWITSVLVSGTSSGVQSDVSSECEELKCRIHQLEKQISWLEKRNEEL